MMKNKNVALLQNLVNSNFLKLLRVTQNFKMTYPKNKTQYGVNNFLNKNLYFKKMIDFIYLFLIKHKNVSQNPRCTSNSLSFYVVYYSTRERLKFLHNQYFKNSGFIDHKYKWILKKVSHKNYKNLTR